jgi:hypothetical protein
VNPPRGGARRPGTPPRTAANPKREPQPPRAGFPAGSAALPARALPRARRLFHEDTFSDGPVTRRFTPQAGPPASVTFTNSLHPINQHPPAAWPAARSTAPGRDPGTTRSSPNAVRQRSQISSATATRTVQPPFCPLISVLCSLISGGERDRTDDLLLAKQALSQLSYTPVSGIRSQGSGIKNSGP